ncbi:radical SAM protein [Dehalogenimonas etheniformans]|uniref:Radical SAM protein n=2 Tax=Dehalogenimonas etheniformans TaxID=1536648 RepID=A0A2P5P5L3_9CHLR|nr:radical SAM protein [Dehalogenimonas etheniformans]
MLQDFNHDGPNVLKDPTRLAEPPNKFLTLEEVMEILDPFELKQVVLEGQEAGLDPAYPLVAEALHNRFGSNNVLLTNGYQLPDLTHTDKVEFGIKAISETLNIHYTGRSNKPVLENLIKTYRMGKKIIVESVLIPEYIGVEEIERIARFVASVSNEIPFIILPYFKSGENPWRRPTKQELESAALAAKQHLSTVYHFTGEEKLEWKVESLFPPGLGRADLEYLPVLKSMDERRELVGV